jgi:two-component system, NarL family, nitrate/nitrite response regulator NarL
MEVMSSELQILLVDDHSLFRESLSRLLQTEPDFHIAGSCSNATEALAVPYLKDIDVVLLDHDLGEEEGTRFLDKVPSTGFRGRTLLVTAGMSDSVMVRALQQGASGIFLKHSPPAHLVEAIRKVATGEVWLDPGVTRSIIAVATGSPVTKQRNQELTEREQAVLHGVFEGLTNKEIGARLTISESSVKAVLQQLFDKTGVRTRSQLVRIAIEKHSEDWLANQR